MSEISKKKACFGQLEKVFPMGSKGLRQSPDECMVCVDKTECLRLAMQACEGLRVQEAAVDRAYRSGMIGFVARWSRKKDLQRRMADQDKPCRC